MAADRSTETDGDAETAEEVAVADRRPPPDRPGAEGFPSRAESRAGAEAANETTSPDDSDSDSDETPSGESSEQRSSADDEPEAPDSAESRPQDDGQADDGPEKPERARRPVAEPVEEEPAEVSPPAVVPEREGHSRSPRLEVSVGESEAPARSETREVPESDPAPDGGTEQSTPSQTERTDTSDVATEPPVITADGGWEWKGLHLTPEDNLIADQAIDARRAAEGRDVNGEYGDRGLTPDMRRVEQAPAYGELVPDAERYALKGSDRFKEKLAKRIALEPDKPTAELAAEIHDGIRYAFTLPTDPHTRNTAARGRKAPMFTSETKYYAVIGQGRTIDDPSGLVRRRPTAQGLVDESIRRDLTWGPTDVFQQIERGEELELPELAEISEQQANGLAERFRRK